MRDSGGDAQDLSTAQQDHEIRTWCSANQLILTHIFIDEAAPGSSTVGRAGFQSMMAYFSHDQRQEIAIVVWKLSRFARQLDDAQFFKSDLRRRGYEVISINENIPPGIDGRLFEAALDWMNAKFLQDLSEDVRRGLHHNLSQHRAIGGTPPRGFRRGDPLDLGMRRNGTSHIVHRWEPDPNMAPLIRQAFEMRAQGESYETITRATYGLLYRIKTSWNHFFANRIYIGEMAYGDQVILDYCEPVVDRATWDAVQKVNEKSLINKTLEASRHPRIRKSDYILTGLLRCGRCGSPLTGETIHSRRKNHTNRYYACTLKKRSSARCGAPNIPKDYLELKVLDELVNHILTLDNLTELRDEARASSLDQTDQIRANITEKRATMASVKKQIDNLAENLSLYGKNRSVMEKISEKERQVDEILADIHQLEDELTGLTHLPPDDEIQDLAAKLQPILREADRPTLRRWLQALIEHIDIERTQKKLTGTIWYYMPGEFTSKPQSHRRVYIHTLNWQII